MQGMDTQWQAVLSRDAAFDGKLFYGVTTTGIYCRPTCPSRRPKRENVQLFQSWKEAEDAGFRACQRCEPKNASAPQIDVIIRVCRYIESHAEQSLPLDELAEVAQLSSFHLLRVFKKATGMTPSAYARLCRLRALKENLRTGKSVSDSLYDSGYGSSSRVYEKSKNELGMTPRTYRDGGISQTIHYTIAPSPLGMLLVAATAKGICAIQFDDDAGRLEQELQNEFPAAVLSLQPELLAPWIDQINSHLHQETISLQLPLDVRATAFQRKVWEILQTIPYGETRTYSELAVMAGKPEAVRAAASACASNPVAVVVPCHRILRTDGSLGGYRWGLSRKVQLLEMERSAQQEK